jgi:hypothetical protein
MANPKPPQKVQQNARKALEKRKEHGRGGTEVGVARARDLSNGKGIPEETLKRMVSFFARHSVDPKSDPTSAASIAWGLWGGTEGYEWAKRELAKIERERED